MSVNSSSNFSLHLPNDECYNSRRNISIFISIFIPYVLLIPLFIFILYVGNQRWRKQRSVATAAMMSHSDIFTFNIVVLELIGLLGLSIYCYGAYTKEKKFVLLGLYITLIVSTGQTLFHLLTCVERYLAVVHPVTYMQLKQSGGVRIRNISIVCVWLLSFVTPGLSFINLYFYISYTLLCAGGSTSVVCFCSLSVLCVLIRPGPGEVGEQRKQRAFYTIMVITGALALKFLNNLVSSLAFFLSILSIDDTCMVMLSTMWFSLPSSLVLPLLFLQRAGKLPGRNHNIESG